MKLVPFTKFTSAVQWDGLSEIRDLFAVPLKLLRGPQRDRGPSLRTIGLNHHPDQFSIAERENAISSLDALLIVLFSSASFDM